MWVLNSESMYVYVCTVGWVGRPCSRMRTDSTVRVPGNCQVVAGGRASGKGDILAAESRSDPCFACSKKL